ncbi:MAG TPA: hypothetical protein VGR10_02940 [Thermoleophilaceae bacterium]|nr:hypothetical protein [Thermoleophilaceae bacterium]
MRMQQSLDRFERQLEEEVAEERERRARLRREAAERSRARRSERVERQGTWRFVGLIVAILLTAFAVTWAMFESLVLLIGP